jgi:pyruvate kinase
MRRTKVICTIGPASSSAQMLDRLVAAGMDVARLNFSHGSHAEHAAVIERLRAGEARWGRPVTILQDLQGPKVRLGTFEAGRVDLRTGAPFTLCSRPQIGDAARASVNHPDYLRAAKPGDEIWMDDGMIRLRVEAVVADEVRCRVTAGGIVSDHKGIFLAGVPISESCLTAKDKADLRFGIEAGVDFVAISYVRSGADIEQVQAFLRDEGASVPIVAKLERAEMVANLPGILSRVDAAMVARGDLGLEVPLEEVPLIQKEVIREARLARVPVIIATQMLESMIGHVRPTRAEVSDVANAIFDGADAIMLSAESAAGKYPIEAVRTMDRIGQEVERDSAFHAVIDPQRPNPEATGADAISAAARQIAETLDLPAILCLTSSGATALRVARERPKPPIVALSPKLETARRLALLWGTHCVVTEDARDVDAMVARACNIAFREGFAREGQRVILVAGVPLGTPGATNMVRIAFVGGESTETD